MKDLFSIETDRMNLSWRLVKESAAAASTIGGECTGTLLVQKRRNLLVMKRICRGESLDKILAATGDNVGPRLFEQSSYRLLVVADGKITVTHRDPTICQTLSYEQDGRLCFGDINFGASVGYSTFSIAIDDSPEIDFTVQVFPSKLDYFSDYEQLLAEVQQSLTGLAFEYLRSTHQLSLPTTGSPSTHIEWLILLEKVFGTLEKALQYIAQKPVRQLVLEPRMERVDRIKRLGSLSRNALLKGKGSGELITLMDGSNVREKIPHQRADKSLNTPEHRWIAQQLRCIRERLAQLRHTEMQRSNSPRSKSTTAVLERLITHISAWEKFEPIKEALGLPPPGFASLQLLTAPGYHEAYAACLTLLLGLRIEGGPLNLSVKDLNELYEYWCYLAVVRIVAETTDAPIEARDLFDVQQSGLHVSLAKGRQSVVPFELKNGGRITVIYNPRYPTGELILIPQKPDIIILLEHPGWPTLSLLVDAKYRLDTSAEYSARYGSIGPPEDALNVLHRYRDAILANVPARATPLRSIIQAVATFPFRESVPNEFRNSKLWKSIERIGIGAIPLLPGSESYLQEWLSNATRSSGWQIADKVVSHSASDWSQQWKHSAGEIVLVGTLRPDDTEEHLEWIIETNRYYFPASSQTRQKAASWVAIYSPSRIRGGRGAVTHVAKVLDFEIVNRSEIDTPWSSSRDGDKLMMLYHLDGVQSLARPIINLEQNGESLAFRTHRWTSRLAIDRAERISELFLEKEQDWRLYEGLRAAGLLPKISAKPLRSGQPASGRARFTFQDLELSWEGTDYLVSGLDCENHCSTVQEAVFVLKCQLQ